MHVNNNNESENKQIAGSFSHSLKDIQQVQRKYLWILLGNERKMFLFYFAPMNLQFYLSQLSSTCWSIDHNKYVWSIIDVWFNLLYSIKSSLKIKHVINMHGNLFSNCHSYNCWAYLWQLNEQLVECLLLFIVYLEFMNK